MACQFGPFLETPMYADLLWLLHFLWIFLACLTMMDSQSKTWSSKLHSQTILSSYNWTSKHKLGLQANAQSYSIWSLQSSYWIGPLGSMARSSDLNQTGWHHKLTISWCLTFNRAPSAWKDRLHQQVLTQIHLSRWRKDWRNLMSEDLIRCRVGQMYFRFAACLKIIG